MTSKYYVTTGRVKAYLQERVSNPERVTIAPVSCAAIKVVDSLYEEIENCDQFETITGSWSFVTRSLKENAGVSVNLSDLRPKGTIGSSGLVSQGITNFMGIYSELNSTIRKGNSFKNGAVNIVCDVTSSDFLDFLASEHDWVKKVAVIPAYWSLDGQTQEWKDKFLASIRSGRLFVYKQQYDKYHRPLEINVCQAILLANRGTCILGHVNLGMVSKPEEIPIAMMESAIELNEVWKLYNDNFPMQYIHPSEDKQVGLGFVGLANMLANLDITYAEFAYSMYKVAHSPSLLTMNLLSDRVAMYVAEGYRQVTKYAKRLNYVRFFTVEPTATCSYNYRDIHGYTTTPEISPPVCHPDTKISRRESDTGYTDHQYPLNVEVAGVDVEYDTYFKLCSNFQSLMDQTGLGHGISHNWWMTDAVTEESFEKWFKSPLKTLYYRWQTASRDTDKSAMPALTKQALSFWAEDDEDDDEPEVVCQLNDKSYCSACAE